MHFLLEYGLFLAKILTIVLSIILIAVVVAGLSTRSKDPLHRLKIKRYNKKLQNYSDALHQKSLNKKALKAYQKEQKKRLKKFEHDDEAHLRKRIFVLRFEGDIRATATEELREIVTAILTTAKGSDEVVACIESTGGHVHAYGFAASQLIRIRDAGIPLTACIDKVAASGGYMMACVAHRVISAPFAILGSIGVIVQVPNFHRLLKKHEIDVEEITAGEYKRTLTYLGENTKKGREKCREDVENTHQLFKTFVSHHRPSVPIEKVSTGEIWYGIDAKEFNLVDELSTSDDYLSNAARDYPIFEVSYAKKKHLSDKVGDLIQHSINVALNRFGFDTQSL